MDSRAKRQRRLWWVGCALAMLAALWQDFGSVVGRVHG
jgi:hypothetical protein